MKRRTYLLTLLLFSAVLLCLPLYAAEHGETHVDKKNESMQMNGSHEGMDMSDDEHVHKETTEAEEAKIGVTEKLGEYINQDAVFRNSKGETVTLKRGG